MINNALLEPKELRKSILRMAHAGDSVHIACAFSIIEICCVLYSNFIQYEKKNLENPLRDHLILSKGHGVMAIYAVFAKLGWLEQVHLDQYFSDGSLLHGLCEAKIPGLEVCSGSLGHGLPIAAGMASAFKRLKVDKQVYCIVGDGELNEGSMWEAILFSGHQKLDNLTVIIDANGLQAMGSCKNVLELEPLPSKFESFGFQVVECYGHDIIELDNAIRSKVKGKPLAVVARTIKGKGVSWMENNNEWHYRRLNDELLQDIYTEWGEQ